MLNALWLRLDAPLQSFGGPLVDQMGRTQDYPGLSLLTGILANALGYDHRDHVQTQRLQGRLRYAVRRDRAGIKLVDFQTVALGQAHLVDTAWTTGGRVDDRAGASSEGTHIRYREYWADAIFTVALTLTPADEAPTLDALAKALQEPERPLFIGRKPCLPSVPLYLGQTQAASLRLALAMAPLPDRRIQDSRMAAWWSEDSDETQNVVSVPVVDERDWANQVHSGRRIVCFGDIVAKGGNDGLD